MKASMNNNMELIVGVVKRETMEEDIKSLLDFDQDFNGSNGKEYIHEETILNNYDSDLDYFYDKFRKDNGIIGIINKIIGVIANYGFYQNLQVKYDVIDNDTTCVAIAYTTA